jgi:hypothetical protein
MFRLRRIKDKFNLIIMSINNKELWTKNFTTRQAAYASAQATLRVLNSSSALFQDDSNSITGPVIYRVTTTSISPTRQKPRK